MNDMSILMSEEETTDAQLNALMQGIGRETRQKAMLAKKQLNEKIRQDIL